MEDDIIAVPPDKYSGKYKISMLNRATMTSLTVRELEKRYGLEGMVYSNIMDVDGKLLTGIQDIKKVMQDYEDHHACTCKESRVKGYRCKKAEVFDLKGTTSDEWKMIL